jgi:peptide-methionine (S)-S-oxide reductase
VTEVVPLTVFYPAEDYHREYYKRNPTKPYCQVVIAPKLAKFRAHFQTRLKNPAMSQKT